jgi:hypothetical protein
MPLNVIQGRRRSQTPPPLPVDTTAPSVPTGILLDSVPSEPYRLLARWNASTDNVAVARYDVWIRPTSGAFAKLTEVTHTGTGQHSLLITNLNYPSIAPSTPYEFYVIAFDTSGNPSAASAVDGATTAALIVTSGWALNTPTTRPYVYWGAGRGSESVGGSGRDVGGPVAAALKVYCVNTLGELRTACQTPGRRRVYITTSGLMDGGADNGITLSDDYLTLIDMSPGYGCVLKGTSFFINGLRHMVIMNMNVFSLCATISLSTSHNCLADWSEADTEQDHWIAYNCMLYATDQTLSYYYNCINVGTFANIFARPTHFNSLHDDNEDGTPDGEHGAGIFYGWRGRCRQVSSIRDIYSDVAFRAPLSGAREFYLADGLVNNYRVAATQFAQQNPDGTVPSFNTVAHMLYIRGPHNWGALPIEAGSPGSLLDTGSRLGVFGNRGIGIPDATQSAMVQQYASPPVTIESIDIPGTVGNGYVSNPIANTTAARIARAQLLCNTSGPRPSNRLPYTQTILNDIMTNANVQPGVAGGLLTQGNQVFPSYTPQTANLLSGGDPMPGVSTQSAAGVDVTVAGRTLITDGGIYDGYSQLDAWEQRKLISMGIGP